MADPAGKLLAGGLGLKSRFVGGDGQECTVEALALQYYASEEGGSWQGAGVMPHPTPSYDIPSLMRVFVGTPCCM